MIKCGSTSFPVLKDMLTVHYLYKRIEMKGSNDPPCSRDLMDLVFGGARNLPLDALTLKNGFTFSTCPQ